ncbi:MAG: translation initiation factor IF-2 N-terminal domain-containing protein, partial [Candidatus Gastranaerophilales bacterium]|nr:translation initiation factor IF-2 N-terminal domain-containing protein [Candidatus Gastranaerophilales bacterium]
MSSDKIRIYDLAKEVNLPAKEVITLLEKHLKLSGKVSASSISAQEATALKNALKPKPQVQEKKHEPAEIEPTGKPEEKGKAYSSTVRHPQRPFKPFDDTQKRPEGERQGQYQSQRRDFNPNRPPRQDGQGGYQGQRRDFNPNRPPRQDGQGGYQGQRREFNPDRPPRQDGQGGYQGQRRDFNPNRPPRQDGQSG